MSGPFSLDTRTYACGYACGYAYVYVCIYAFVTLAFTLASTLTFTLLLLVETRLNRRAMYVNVSDGCVQ